MSEGLKLIASRPLPDVVVIGLGTNWTVTTSQIRTALRILVEVVQPQRLRVADQHTEDPTAAGQVADRGARPVVDSGRDETLELLAGRVEHAERRVLRSREPCS